MLAKRQLRIKGNDSSSWFIAIKIILRKYDLLEAVWYLDNPVKKSIWTALIKKTVFKYWSKSITDMTPLYSGLQYLSYENFSSGKTHPIFKIDCHSPLDIARLPVKLKLLTGSYILQSKRIKMYKSESDPRCLLCKREAESEEHLILKSEKLISIRNPIIEKIFILDITTIAKSWKLPPASVVIAERLTRRLLHQIHLARYKILCVK